MLTIPKLVSPIESNGPIGRHTDVDKTSKQATTSSCRPIVFTLLTACKNEEKDIHLALDSALAQTYPHKEIIFVDDSNDGKKEIIKRKS